MAIAATQAVLNTVINWTRFTEDTLEKLKRAESRLLEPHDVDYESKHVQVRFKKGEMHTISVKPREGENPNGEAIVFIPGLGSGAAMFAANFETCAKNHAVHALDLLGFGRSTRTKFSNDNAIAELEMVEAIEDWRKEMGIEKMYLIGHAFGGYMASAYALEHPLRVAHLILVDPWGFAEKVEYSDKMIKPYAWMSFLGGVAGYFNPFSPMRWMGPYAPAIVQKLRPDLIVRFPGIHDRDNNIYKYVYYLNLPDPTGETAYMNMTLPVGWAKRPMIKRFNGIDKNVGVTFIYGSKSWVDPGPAIDIQSIRKNAYVDIKIVRGAGTHVYADEVDAFNKLVTDIVEGRLTEPSNDFELEECFHSD